MDTKTEPMLVERVELEILLIIYKKRFAECADSNSLRKNRLLARISFIETLLFGNLEDLLTAALVCEYKQAEQDYKDCHDEVKQRK